MADTEKRKQSVYIPADMLREINAEATRQDRSLSWMIQRAWKIARGEIKKAPTQLDHMAGASRTARAPTI